jgi:hypothetical protein
MFPSLKERASGFPPGPAQFRAVPPRSIDSFQIDNFDAFIDHDLDNVLEGRVPQKLFGYIEFGVDLRFGTNNRGR